MDLDVAEDFEPAGSRNKSAWSPDKRRGGKMEMELKRRKGQPSDRVNPKQQGVGIQHAGHLAADGPRGMYAAGIFVWGVIDCVIVVSNVFILFCFLFFERGQSGT